MLEEIGFKDIKNSSGKCNKPKLHFFEKSKDVMPETERFQDCFQNILLPKLCQKLTFHFDTTRTKKFHINV